MKRLLILLGVGAFMLFSCSKLSRLREKTFTPGLTGKWNYAEYYYSVGGPLIYKPAESPNQWIIFNDDSSFTSNMTDFDKVMRYEKMDSSKVKLIASQQQPAFRLYHYALDSISNTLSLSPADFICIEGCGYKFKR